MTDADYSLLLSSCLGCIGLCIGRFGASLLRSGEPLSLGQVTRFAEG